MSEIIQQYWLVFAAIAFVALLILIWLIGRASKPAPRERTRDVLDEGAAPATRNQALIDSPMAMPIMPPAGIAATTVVDPLGGMSEAVAAPTGSVAAPFAKTRNAEAEQWEAAERAETPFVSPTPSATPPIETPVVAATPVAVPEVTHEADVVEDLSRLKGVGPKLVALLRTLHVTRFAQIADWNEADIDRIDAQLGPFQGRIRRDAWVEQARLLAGGDISAYEAKFGKL